MILRHDKLYIEVASLNASLINLAPLLSMSTMCMTMKLHPYTLARACKTITSSHTDDQLPNARKEPYEPLNLNCTRQALSSNWDRWHDRIKDPRNSCLLQKLTIIKISYHSLPGCSHDTFYNFSRTRRTRNFNMPS